MTPLEPSAFFDPIALAVVGGGTVVATCLRAPLADVGRGIAALAVLPRRRFRSDPLEAQIATLSRLARTHGVIALDRTVIADPDIAAAIADIVDGHEPAIVAEGLERRRRDRIERHAAAADMWAGAAEVAPAMGMVGTLIGLVAMFTRMGDPQLIGGAMAVALLATLYGAILANLIAMPVASRLRAAGRAEALGRQRLAPPLIALAAREAPLAHIPEPHSYMPVEATVEII